MKYRTERISIRTTPIVKMLLNKICRQNKITKSHFLDLAVTSAGKYTIKKIRRSKAKSNRLFNSDSRIISKLEDINDQIRRSGNNLNQIARKINQGAISPKLVHILNDTNKAYHQTLVGISRLENKFSKARR